MTVVVPPVAEPPAGETPNASASAAVDESLEVCGQRTNVAWVVVLA